jgi:hypothetical protein
MTRTSLSKKIRFEVFKRDKFTCQYCGEKSPDVILEVDHIDPVAKGGSNDLINLITSCKNCNRGKRDIKLDDSTVLNKQRQQLEELEERREQIKMMLDWRKSLDTLEDDTLGITVDYIESKIPGFSLNDTGQDNIKKYLQKFSFDDLLDAIDISSKKYLRYIDGALDKSSVEDYISKIGGILTLKNKSQIEQKLAYIKGICRNRFSYFDPKKASILLNDYVQALEKYGWTESQILNDLENELIAKTKESKNWTVWRDLIEKWIEDVNGWINNDNEISKPTERDVYPIETLETHANIPFSENVDKLKALLYLGKVFPNFTKDDFIKDLIEMEAKFINNQIDLYSNNENVPDDPDYIDNFLDNSDIYRFFDDDEMKSEDFGLVYVLGDKAKGLIKEIFINIYFPDTSYKNCEIMDLLNFHSKLTNELKINAA